MQLKELFKIKNIKSFFEGNMKYYYDQIFGLPKHIREQVMMRLELCQHDCLTNNQCIECGCPTNKKVFVTKSCNPDRFPDLMDKEEWDKYLEGE